MLEFDIGLYIIKWSVRNGGRTAFLRRYSGREGVWRGREASSMIRGYRMSVSRMTGIARFKYVVSRRTRQRSGEGRDRIVASHDCSREDCEKRIITRSAMGVSVRDS
jgi:hypothetical protein